MPLCLWPQSSLNAMAHGPWSFCVLWHNVLATPQHGYTPLDTVTHAVQYVFPTHHAPSFHDMFYLQAQFWHNQFYHFHFPHPRARNPGFRIAQLSSEKHCKFVPRPPCGILCSPSERFCPVPAVGMV